MKLIIISLILAGFLHTSCAQNNAVNISKEQAIEIAGKHLQQYGRYPANMTLVEAELGEGWSNQYWARFNQTAIEGTKQTCWVVQFYYSVPGMDGQFLVYVDKLNGIVIGGTQTK